MLFKHVSFIFGRIPRYKPLCLVLLAAVGVLGGCRSVPREQLTSYVQTFDTARLCGEEIIADYGRVKREHDVRRQLTALPTTGDALDLPEELTRWQSSADVAAAADTDGVALRYSAWQAIAEYNDTLVAYANGASEARISAALTNLGGTLTHLAGVAGSINPALVALQPVLTKVVAALDEQVRAQRFADALGAAKPAIHGIINIFKDDLAHLFAIRLALLQSDLGPMKMDLADASTAFSQRMQELDVAAFAVPDGLVPELISQFRALAVAKAYPDLIPTGSANGKKADPELAVLNTMLAAVASRQEAHDKSMARAVVELKDFRALIDLYSSLLVKLSAQLDDVASAATKKVPLNNDRLAEIARLALDTRAALRALRRP